MDKTSKSKMWKQSIFNASASSSSCGVTLSDLGKNNCFRVRFQICFFHNASAFRQISLTNSSFRFHICQNKSICIHPTQMESSRTYLALKTSSRPYFPVFRFGLDAQILDLGLGHEAHKSPNLFCAGPSGVN